MKRILPLPLIALLAASASSQTFFGPGLPDTIHYAGMLFDVENVASVDITLTGRLNLTTNWTSDGVYRVYTRPGSYVGGENAVAAGWTQLGSDTTINGAGAGTFATLDVGESFNLAQGASIGVALFQVGGTGISVGNGAIGYRSGTGVFSDGSLQFTTGAIKGYGTFNDPFATHTVADRTWAGQLEYAPVPEPATFAALGIGALALVRRRRR